MRMHLENALCWILKHKEHFWNFERLPDERTVKSFGELQLLLHVIAIYNQGQDLDLRWFIDPVKNFSREALSCPSVSSLMHDAEYSLPNEHQSLLFAYLLMRLEGYSDPCMEHIVDIKRNLGLLSSLHAFTVTGMQFEYLLHLLKLTPQAINITDAYIGSDLIGLNLASMDTFGAYKLTHAIFWVTDMGRIPLALGNPDQTRLNKRLNALLVRFLKEENWDIVGELLICLYAVKRFSGHLVDYALQWIQRVQLELGAWPASGEEREKLVTKGDDEVAKFRCCYHTTLVVAMLLLMMLVPARNHA
jgi:hypothetical protein